MRKNSIINLELSLDDVLEAMLLHVIENEVRSEPYITIVSKKQLWFGNGPHFGNAEDFTKQGLRANAGVKLPSAVEIEKKNAFYGYEALIPPWREFNQITNSTMRKRVLVKTINSGELNDVRVLLGRGYIRKDGTMDPRFTKGISVYVLFMSDGSFRPTQNAWIASQEEWVRLQIARNQHTHFDILQEKKQAASTLVTLNRKLINQEEWKQLDPAVDRDKITWDVDD